MGNAHSENKSSKTKDSAVDEQDGGSKEGTKKGGGETIKRSPSLLDFVHQILQPEEQVIETENRGPRPPKHMLWGCTTAEEHYSRIKEVCETASALPPSQSAEERLRLLGFEFRLVQHPHDTCVCNNVDDDNSLSDSEDDEQATDDTEDLVESYMVPIGVPLEKSLSSYMLGDVDGNGDVDTAVPPADKADLPRQESSISLFSLSTHYSTGSSKNDQSQSVPSRPPPPNAIHEENDSDHCCALRLHHIASGIMLTAENHQTYVAHGKMYDLLADLCMEYAQQVMVEEGQLQWVSVGDDHDDDVRVLVSSDSRSTKKRVLLVCTGKGQVRAGIFSRRLLMTMGVESATALPFIREANKRSMEVIMLDPNSKGWKSGMQVVETSLEKVFLKQARDEKEEVYVLAHSMAGSQLVRFLLNKTATVSAPAASVNLDSNTASDANPEDEAEAAWSFFRKLQAVAFTDSNHNINWTKKNPPLTEFFSGQPCLYIKSHKVHDAAKALGELHHDCEFWRHRFGDIRTLWAGTHEHALTNYIARFHIWDHFDYFLNKQLEEEPNDDLHGLNGPSMDF